MDESTVQPPRKGGISASSEPEDSVLSKVRLLLDAFSGSVHTLGLTELSRRSGVSKASTFRLAEQLVGHGLLVKTPRGYQLGWWLYEMGQLVPGPSRLRTVARPTLVDLRAATKALVVHLAIPHGDDVVYLDRIGGRREIAILAAVGTSVPADQTVSGRVLQAYWMRDDDPAVPDDLRTELAMIRDRRWASEHGLVVPGAKTLAVPVHSPARSHVIAVISATVAVGRSDDLSTLSALWGASAEISRALQRTPVR
ncbi:IclR family transcriptional regulator [Paenarthrobacter nitroguajacolicus]|uniref:IclR family transcriptional regulator n=1 Tax=Paenarthrobacter nitroguajacolicus TaxID=211146 RepID=UPI00286A651C|nr:IclR family transcriptional regulator [Paenarthrobacter nitroguajacolicus]